MATPCRRTDPPLEDLLFAEPYRFEFFQAVRLLRRLGQGRGGIGRDGPPGREPVRFRALTSLAFPPSQVADLTAAADDVPPAMTVTFMGLTGPLGVLPPHYTEILLSRSRDGDHTMAAFLDLFNHRMISLFFRAWEKYRPALAHECGEPDGLARALFALMGLGTPSLQGRHLFPESALLFHAGAFAQRRRPAVALEQLLSVYFGVAVQVQQFVGTWLKLEPGDRSVVGRNGKHNALGTGLMLGASVWDEQGTFCLRIGPLARGQFLTFLPGTLAFRALIQMTRLFVDGELDFKVQLVLKAEDVPPCRLRSAGNAGSCLGRTAWVQGRPRVTDAADAVFPAPT